MCVFIGVQFTSRSRSYSFALDNMPSGTPAIFPFPPPLDEHGLYRRGVQVGFDGSLLWDNMLAYVVPRFRAVRYPCYSKGAFQRIDYFHGCGYHRYGRAMPMCQMFEDKCDFPAVALVGPSGFVGKRIIHIQRRWRRWRRESRRKRYGVQMVRFGIMLCEGLKSRKCSYRRD